MRSSRRTGVNGAVLQGGHAPLLGAVGLGAAEGQKLPGFYPAKRIALPIATEAPLVSTHDRPSFSPGFVGVLQPCISCPSWLFSVPPCCCISLSPCHPCGANGDSRLDASPSRSVLPRFLPSNPRELQPCSRAGGCTGKCSLRKTVMLSCVLSFPFPRPWITPGDQAHVSPGPVCSPSCLRALHQCGRRV